MLPQPSDPVHGMIGWGYDLRDACARGDEAALTEAAERYCNANSLEFVCPVWEVTERGTMRSPLHVAALHGQDAIVSLLVETWQHPVSPQTSTGLTPLHEAAFNAHPSTLTLLIALGCDPLQENLYGRPALDCVGRGERAFHRADDAISCREYLAACISRDGAGESITG